MPEVVLVDSLYFDNILSSNMSACILTSIGRILYAALGLFVFHLQKSNKIYILVQELDHLLLLSYFDNFLYFESVLIISCFTLLHLLSH